MSKKIKIILGGVLIVFGLILSGRYVFTHIYSLEGNRIVSVQIKQQVFQAEVVSSAAKMQQGLAGRQNLCDVCAMLFKFSEVGEYNFWMKGMRFPLDILWLRDKKIVWFEKNVAADFAEIIVPKEKADAVLELKAGTIEKMNLQVGQSVQY